MANLTGGMAYPQPTSVVVGSSAPPIKLGTRARDDSGNEYVYVDFQAPCMVGELFAISSTFTATDCTGSTVGLVGLSVANATSDSCGWLQIYGTGAALGSSVLHIGAVSLDATSDGVSFMVSFTTALTQIEGLYVVAETTGGTNSSAAWSSATSPATSASYTSASSQLGGLVTVQLNYPFYSGGAHAVQATSA